MADERKFKFISPGVFIDEIDNSQLPAEQGAIGPLVIGTAPQGPAMVPVTVNSFSDLVETFGEPNAGQPADDAWRNGQLSAPSYGLYAAQAWLRNNAPLTFLRLVGEEDPEATAAGQAGWKAGTLSSTPSEGGAFALVAFPSGSVAASTAKEYRTPVSGAVAAIFYANEGRVVLSGNFAGPTAIATRLGTGSLSTLIETDDKGRFHLAFAPNGTDPLNSYSSVVSLNPDDRNFIRKVLNTNPTVVNSAVTTQQTRTSNQGGGYWLGESFERQLKQVGSGSMGVLGTDIFGTRHHLAMFPMRNQVSTTQDQNDHNYGSKKASTGWFIAQNLNVGADATFQAQSQQKLFRIEARTGGQSPQRKVKITIENIKAPEGEFEKYGSFSLVIRKIHDTDLNQKILERYDSLNLNPASSNYIAKVIGDKFVEYDTATKTNREYGSFTNKSKYVRVVMDEDVDRGTTNSEFLPFGVFGPMTYRAATIVSGSGGLSRYGKYHTNFQLSASRGALATMLDGGSDATFGDPGGYHRTVYAGSEDNFLVFSPGSDSKLIVNDSVTFTGSFVFPSTPLRRHQNWGRPGVPMKNVYWGAWTGINYNDQTFDPGVLDTLTAKPSPSSTSNMKSFSSETPSICSISEDLSVIELLFRLV